MGEKGLYCVIMTLPLVPRHHRSSHDSAPDSFWIPDSSFASVKSWRFERSFPFTISDFVFSNRIYVFPIAQIAYWEVSFNPKRKQTNSLHFFLIFIDYLFWYLCVSDTNESWSVIEIEHIVKKSRTMIYQCKWRLNVSGTSLKQLIFTVLVLRVNIRLRVKIRFIYILLRYEMMPKVSEMKTF